MATDIFIQKNSPELLDFDGRPIRIKRKGIRTPVDMELKNESGRNILSIETNVMVNDVELDAPEKVTEAIMEGIKEWEGEYTVFNGQEVSVEVAVTDKIRLLDSIYFVPITETFQKVFQKAAKLPVGSAKNRKMLIDSIKSQRSFAAYGLKKWSIYSRKLIYFSDRDGSFTHFDDIKKVVKHEFGHALGLGDLYRSVNDGLLGVKHGKYRDVDKNRYLRDYYYDLVMCNEGMVSNNDIEMVILAFQENEMQHYQEDYKTKKKEKISKALGRGD